MGKAQHLDFWISVLWLAGYLAAHGRRATTLGRAAAMLQLKEVGAQWEEGLLSPLGNPPHALTRAHCKTTFPWGNRWGNCLQGIRSLAPSTLGVKGESGA